MLSGVLDTIEKYNMLSPNDIVVVGVSGGPDSISLLHILYHISQSLPVRIHAAHLNHMLRGQESDEDTEYVKEFCRKMDIPCTVRYVDINELSKKSGVSHEEAGRMARYKLFSDVYREIGATKIALAHNMNDQAETVLMRIMRGTGLDGLCGIKPVRDGVYIRPLLETPRSEIEEYCKANNLNPRIDSSNLKPVYARNKVRLELIPYIRENFNSNIETTLSSMSQIICEDNDFLNNYADNIYSNVVKPVDCGVALDIENIKNYHNSIKKRVVRKAISEVKGNLTGIENKHIELIISIIMSGSTGAAVDLLEGIRAYISYNTLRIEIPRVDEGQSYSYNLNIPGSTCINEICGEIKSDVFEEPGIDYHTGCRFIKYFDYDKINSNLIVRCRQEGDYIIPLGMKGRKKIKELFIDNKVPKDERGKVPLIASGKEIIWAVGCAINDKYKIDSNTKKVLKMEFKHSGGDCHVK
jgi:tRNA(Ile)-lysidine synthetase, N-terminal domain/tRNA(Ile)-lysidine synthetase, C-terminal domain